MRFRNTTDFPDQFVRRMLRWCIRETELPASTIYRGHLRSATFTRCARAYRGRGGCGRIMVRIADEATWARETQASGGKVNHGWRRAYKWAGTQDFFLDRIETLVHLTSHELAHCRQTRLGRVMSEAEADSLARTVTAAFRRNRGSLLAGWSEPAKVSATI